ncbi:MAG: ribokinase [Ilumatobacteraceae bacterium]
MSSRTDVCVVGSCNADLVVRTSRWPERGETVVGSAVSSFLGGKGFNQAIAAARAGARTALVGALGDDEHGAQIRAVLDREGIDATGVRDAGAVGTGMALVIVDDGGENSIIVVPRANHSVAVDDVVDAPAISSASVVLLQLELPVATVAAAAAAGRRAGAVVVLNPAPAIDDLAPLRGVVDVVVPNETELVRLAGAGPGGTASAAARLAAATGARVVVVTLGARGALVWTADSVTEVPPHAVRAVDTVGAGDAFCGYLAARLADGLPLVDAARHANAAGALATTRPGAEPSMPSAVEVADLLGHLP